MALVEGSIVAGRFLVEGRAGRGGMGEVFRARDARTGDRVALKLLHADGALTTERFRREAEVLSELRHPGIVSYLSHGETEDGQPYLAIEWLDGQDLAVHLEQGPLRIRDCVTLLEKITDALALAHGHGVVHRDLKPRNLFLRDGRIDRVTLLDFGIARWSRGAPLTRTGHLLGTPGYMAPEQARGDGELGPSADIFALGCVLFECLAGEPVFSGEHLMAVLAKVLFEEIPPVEALRPTTPAALSALLARMLDKDPARRPPDAAALRGELAALDLPSEDDELSPPRGREPSSAVLAGDVLQLLCVVLAVPSAAPSSRDPEMLAEARPEQQPLREALSQRLTRLGARIEWLADGALAAIVRPSANAGDQAALAARCALAIQEDWPEATVAMSTGRGLVRRQLPAGEAIDRAALLVRRRGEAPATEAGVWLDELSARLLEVRFVITTSSGQPLLSGERVTADESRPLLGRPTPCVGRERELAMLMAVLDETIENAAPAGVLVIAPPGLGKSRLKHEFLRRLSDRSIDAEVLSGSGAPMHAGSPYGILGEALRNLCDVRVGDAAAAQEEKIKRRMSRHVPAADAGRVSEFIAALCGIPVEAPSVLLHAARSDPKIMGEQIQRAFEDLLRAECRARPCALVLEDLHWGDPATVKLVDVALSERRDRPLFVLAFARPELMDLFPKLWDRRRVQQLRLVGLSRRAAERLIKAVLGAEVAERTTRAIVEQADGNALFLEELIRAAAEGELDAKPDTVLAMLQARLSLLPSQARRVLCSASIFGQTFWRGGVRALLGREGDTRQTERRLDELLEAEIIAAQRRSRFPEELEYRFRHALVRDAAYSLLPDDDRALGHRLAGPYLERVGESDPAVLAEHAHLGGDLPRAALFYLRATEQSYQRDDYEGMFARAEHGIACGAGGEILGRLLALKAEACVWRLDWQSGLRMGREAMSLLPRGSISWNNVAGSFALMAGNMALMDEFSALVDAVRGAEPEPDAVASYCVAAGLTTSMLSLMGERDVQLPLLERLSQLGRGLPESEVLAHGQIHMSRSCFGYFLGDDPWPTCEAARLSEAAFATACASRYQGMARMLRGAALAALGDQAEAERVLRDYLDTACRTNDAFAASTARYYLVLVLTERCAPEQHAEIKSLATALIDGGAMEDTVAWGHGTLARVLMAEGRLDEAREAAEKALGLLQHIRCWRPSIYRTLIEIRLREGRADAAREVAEEGLRCIASFGGSSGYSEVPLRLAITEARAAAGDMAAAREALAHTIRVIDARAARIPDLAARDRYLAQIPEHVRARELARAWLEAVARS